MEELPFKNLDKEDIKEEAPWPDRWVQLDNQTRREVRNGEHNLEDLERRDWEWLSPTQRWYVVNHDRYRAIEWDLIVEERNINRALAQGNTYIRGTSRRRC